MDLAEGGRLLLLLSVTLAVKLLHLVWVRSLLASVRGGHSQALSLSFVGESSRDQFEKLRWSGTRVGILLVIEDFDHLVGRGDVLLLQGRQVVHC